MNLVFHADLELNAKNLMPCMICGAPAGEACVNSAVLKGRNHPQRNADYRVWQQAFHKNELKFEVRT